MNYHPDAWRIIEFKWSDPDREPMYKVLAGWQGGYTDGDSWRLNSGITDIIEHDNYYMIKSYSGSEYICNKNSEQMSLIMSSAYNTIAEISSCACDDVIVSLVDINSILDKFKGQTMDKVIRDGKVAVLISEGYGAGWSTWSNKVDKVFDPKIVEILEQENTTHEEKIELITKHCDATYPDDYSSGIDGLYIVWVPVGTRFAIFEYDGSEWLETIDSIEWIEA